MPGVDENLGTVEFASFTATASTGEPAGVRELAESLMSAHGLAGWSLVFDDAKTRAGLCNRTARKISLSIPLMSRWPETQQRDTILHEIAHALTAGGHDAQWRAMCRRIGADPSRTWDESNESIRGRYAGTCPAGHVIYRHRLTQGARRMSCSRCSPRYDTRCLFTWTVTGD